MGRDAIPLPIIEPAGHSTPHHVDRQAPSLARRVSKVHN